MAGIHHHHHRHFLCNIFRNPAAFSLLPPLSQLPSRQLGREKAVHPPRAATDGREFAFSALAKATTASLLLILGSPNAESRPAKKGKEGVLKH